MGFSRFRALCVLAWKYRSALVTLVTPLALLPLPIIVPTGLTPESSSCLYVLLLMAVYWITEALPISATALIPMVLLPLMGVMKSGDVAKCYQKDTIMLIIGGFLVAVAVESSNVHRRISVFMLRLAGSNMRMLMLGFMVPTWFLSMWMSNTATTAVMVPIVQAVISELKKGIDDPSNPDDAVVDAAETGTEKMDAIPMSDISDSSPNRSTVDLLKVEKSQESVDRKQAEWTNVSRALTLCVCYASTIGGMATLTGNPPNIILVENLESISVKYQNYSFDLNFVTWMVLGLPISIILLLLAWAWLQILFLGFRCANQNQEQGERIKKIIAAEYSKLKPVSFYEAIVVAHVGLLIVLWLSRDPGNAGGWHLLFKKGYVSDTTAVLLVSLMLFIVPSQAPKFMCCRRNYDTATSERGPSESCLTWQAVHSKLPWGVVVLIGGGFALAEAIEVSGLSTVISALLGSLLKGMPDWALIMVVSAITSLVTQITSNTTVATLFLPIIGLVAEESKIHPLYIMFPACLSTSFAFMLPVATPSNAIVFSTGILRIIDMVKGGTVLTILGILLATLATITWGKSYFHMDYFPYDPVLTLSSTQTLISG